MRLIFASKSKSAARLKPKNQRWSKEEDEGLEKWRQKKRDRPGYIYKQLLHRAKLLSIYVGTSNFVVNKGPAAN